MKDDGVDGLEWELDDFYHTGGKTVGTKPLIPIVKAVR
jgi:hypothetical protein